MNLLQMVQFVQGNIATSVDLPFAGPATIVGASGQYLEFVNFVQQAYKAIQLDNQNWRFRTRSGQLNLTAGQNFYTLGQIQSQVPDYEEIVHLHFWDDTAYGLIAKHQNNPANTTTVGAITENNGTFNVTVANVTNFAPFQTVFVNGGANEFTGTIQSINGLVLSFAADQIPPAQIIGSILAIAPGSPVSIAGNPVPVVSPNFSDQTFCFFVQYQNWRGWKDRNVLPLGKPVYYTKTPDQSLEFNPVPDATTAPYVFFFDYRTALDVLNPLSDTSTPASLPPRYHEAICWKAIMYWCVSRKQADRYVASKTEYDRIYEKMVIEQLPDIEPYLMELYS